jgi:YebC/PmpR family DNA-binding regulatory protein
MYRKGAQDAKKAKTFTKVTREITVAVKEGGADPAANPRLRAAIAAARAVNMPKDNIERAIKKAQGGEENTQYVAIRYEGYGPGGVAIIVEALTDNRNRTAAEVRSAFSKHGGTLGEANSVSFQFEHTGLIIYPATVASADSVFEAAVEAGAEDVESTAEGHFIRCAIANLNDVREALAQKFGDPQSATIVWDAKNTVAVSAEVAQTLFKLIDVLEDNDDVQHVFANYDIDEEVMKSLTIK